MNNETTIKRQHSGSDSDVLIVYDSVRSGKPAKELCDRFWQPGESHSSLS
jgi:hypothetical protein